MSDSIQLNPAEDNELCFEISIEGSTTKESVDKSIVRFHLAEASLGSESCLSYTFPATRIQNGSVKVIIPQMTNVIKEDKRYTGSLEVIIGGQYFVPQTVDVSFQRPLKVEAKGVVVNNKPQQTSDVLSEKSTQAPKVSSKISVPQKQQAPTKQPVAPVQRIKESPSIKNKLSAYSPEEQVQIRKELLKMKQLKESKQKESDYLDLSFLEDDDDD